MEKLFFVLFGMILGIGITVFYYNVRKQKKSSVTGGGGQPGYNKPDTNENQTT